MLLTNELIEQSRYLDTLQSQIFSKSVSYTINFILNAENQMKLFEFIEIQEQDGDRVTETLMRIIQYLCKHRVSLKEMTADIHLLKLQSDKKQILKEKITKNIDQLRNKMNLAEGTIKTMEFVNLSWRFEAEVGSKTYQQDFQPNVLLNFQFHDRNRNKQVNNLVNCDYANLKNLHETLTQAFKMHRSNKFKLARNSSV